MKLGIFDSGIGGEAVAASLGLAYPNAEIVTVNDREHLPYGNRDIDDIARLTDRAIQPLLGANCDIIVIACNSATAAAIEALRETYPSQLFIGLEPMIKPAALQTNSGVIAICATLATLSSRRYQSLKEQFAKDILVLEPDCSTWARMIEDSKINESIIHETIDDVISQGADVIVLACTHYHWVRAVVEASVDGRATVLDPSEAIAKRVSDLLIS